MLNRFSMTQLSVFEMTFNNNSRVIFFKKFTGGSRIQQG